MQVNPSVHTEHVKNVQVDMESNMYLYTPYAHMKTSVYTVQVCVALSTLNTTGRGEV